MHLTSLLALYIAGGLSSPLSNRAVTPAVVNFANDTGAPEHLASGLLYGVPDKKNQIQVRSLLKMHRCC